jgi:hypothetical protein
MSRRRAVLLGAATAALLGTGLAGCGADVEPAQDTQTAPMLGVIPTTTLSATPTGPDHPHPTRPAASKLRPPLSLHVRRRAMLRLAPGGKMVARIPTKTEFGSPTILSVAARKPGWVLVRTSIPGHHVGWLPVGAGALFSEPRSIVIDLSRRSLTVFHRGTLTDVYKVAVGTDATPTNPRSPRAGAAATASPSTRRRRRGRSGTRSATDASEGATRRCGS